MKRAIACAPSSTLVTWSWTTDSRWGRDQRLIGDQRPITEPPLPLGSSAMTFCERYHLHFYFVAWQKIKDHHSTCRAHFINLNSKDQRSISLSSRTSALCSPLPLCSRNRPVVSDSPPSFAPSPMPSPPRYGDLSTTVILAHYRGWLGTDFIGISSTELMEEDKLCRGLGNMSISTTVIFAHDGDWSTTDCILVRSCRPFVSCAASARAPPTTYSCR